MLVLGLGCAAAVGVAAGARLWQAHGRYWPAARSAGTLAILGGGAALAAWLPAGPLGDGWARRAGTPLSLLVPKRTADTRRPPPRSPARSVQASASQDALTGEAIGQLHEGITRKGTALVDIALRIASPERRRLDVRIAGTPEAGGGVALRTSQVTFGPPRDPARYVGQLTALSGTRMAARLRPLRGRAIDLQADLVIDQAAGSARGRVSVRPVG
jgi:hypothetical protein